MKGGRRRQEEPVPVSLGVRPGVDLAILASLVIVVVLLGIFGRLVPLPSSVSDPGRSPVSSSPVQAGSSVPVIQLVAPGAGVLMLRSTEVLVRGEANAGIRRIEATVSIGGRPSGEAVLEVGVGRRFSGVIAVTPPAHRTPATLQVREAGQVDVLTEVEFSIEAGALLLPKDPSAFHGRAGRVLGSTKLSVSGAVRVDPRTVAIELEIPSPPLPDRARLHLLGIDGAGKEVEHVDANVVLSGS
jgi:hypothetical protein